MNATFRANQEAIIPLFKVGENGNIIINNNKPVMINGKPSDIIPNTHHSYFFDQRPNDDAIELSKSYFDKLKVL
ncbi:MAG: hypothetical protein E6K94_10055 [Thaumarchaeota archaeon]|nr:MAG: hypothetical protein E6L01_04490 [Nitrososphaerota archaeon]TLX89441.1 MAG: hypothetical protein E6K94_10055 [Nitrososphaerota archaeon]